jgi:uncharacterized protein (DUF952 family)
LRFEASRGGELFPHLYAALPIERVAWSVAIAWARASHVWPPEIEAAR